MKDKQEGIDGYFLFKSHWISNCCTYLYLIGVFKVGLYINTLHKNPMECLKIVLGLEKDPDENLFAKLIVATSSLHFCQQEISINLHLCSNGHDSQWPSFTGILSIERQCFSRETWTWTF